MAPRKERESYETQPEAMMISEAQRLVRTSHREQAKVLALCAIAKSLVAIRLQLENRKE